MERETVKEIGELMVQNEMGETGIESE